MKAKHSRSSATPSPPPSAEPAAGPAAHTAPLTLVATTAFGLEAVVARQVERLGFTERTVTNGRVTFGGDERAVCRTNLHLRSAGRVLIELGRFDAEDFGELFDRTLELPWNEWLPADAAFPVRARATRSRLMSTPDIQRLVKKAIVENLKRAHRRDWFEETGPVFAIDVSIMDDSVSVCLDSSGDALHKRGYRTVSGPAPLKETLAAALVELSFWRPGRPFLDPFCGTGTIPIEAALIARNRAPGIARRFAAEDWPRIPAALWSAARDEARAGEQPASDEPLQGTDIDSRSLELARFHARQAGVEADVHFQQRALADVSSRRKYGCVITNPPYGERSGELREVEALYGEMGRVLAALDTWSVYVLTSHDGFERLFGRRADRRRKLYNGRIRCTYYQFHGPRPPA